VLKNETGRVAQLWENTWYMKYALKQLGFDLGKSETPIIPIFVRNDMLTFRFASKLLDEGIFVNPVVSPAVPADSSLIRLSLMATHTIEQMDIAIEKINSVAKSLGILQSDAAYVVQ
jgi:8-amino-7-oxononanoate synthase